jgi:ABC-type enterochelin transport system substrate-binding protein
VLECGAMGRKHHVKKVSFKPLTPLQQVEALASIFGRDKKAEELALYYLTEIAASQRRMRKMSKKMDRTDKKIQAILDELH